ncbi:unnamed protein product [Leptosia nina]|uniref:DRBM domain-containing protein n=1 Tax=Leptosia nina TaxID=320188 RepID=A0AAV1J5M5_9NEOP
MRRGVNGKWGCIKKMMKTAVSVLQEMMVKSGQVPEYECVSQSGPNHRAMFKYRCSCNKLSVTASARSKKEAKQEVARRMLAELFIHGTPVPAPYARPPSPRSPSPDVPEPPETKALPSTGVAPSTSTVQPDIRSYVALLKELCEQYVMGAPQYELIGDAGLPHQRQFTMSVRLGKHERVASASTKKTAKQLAAEQLYKYLRTNLTRLTQDFVEEDALLRAHEKAMERYVEEKSETIFRPPLNQKIADYHLDKDKLNLGKEALEATTYIEDPVNTLVSVCATMDLDVKSQQVQGDLWIVNVTPSAPPISTAGVDRNEAHASALRYLRRVLERTHLYDAEKDSSLLEL